MGNLDEGWFVAPEMQQPIVHPNKGARKLYTSIKIFDGDDRVDESTKYIAEHGRSGLPWRPRQDELLTEIETCPLPWHWRQRGGGGRQNTNPKGVTSYFYD